MPKKVDKSFTARQAMILATGPLLKKIFEAFLNKLYGQQATNTRGVPVDYFDESVLGTSKNMRRAKFNKEKISKKSELVKKIAETIEENKTDFEDQHIYRMLFGFLNGDSKHIVSPPKVELSNV